MTMNSEKAIIGTDIIEKATNKIENKIIKVILTEYHTKEYLRNLKRTTYKNKKVVFILPNGKEYGDEKR